MIGWDGRIRRDGERVVAVEMLSITSRVYCINKSVSILRPSCTLL
jgi:hypothetical protein